MTTDSTASSSFAESTPQPSVSEALLRHFVRQMPSAVAMFDTEMRYLVTSDRWMRDAELQGQKIIGRCHYEVVPEIPERWKTIHRSVLAGSTEACERDVFVRRDGSSEWLQWQLEPWRREDGTIGGLMMFIQFITERVRMEEAFRASEDRFRSTMNHSPIGMAIVELDGRVAEANPALSCLLGYTVSALCQTDFSRFTHSEDITLDFADMRRLLNRDVDSFSLQKRFIHRAGHVVWAQVGVSLIQTAGGVPRHLVYQIEDITQRKAEENGHREAAAKLTLAMDMARLGYWEYDVTTSQFTFDENSRSLIFRPPRFSQTTSQANIRVSRLRIPVAAWMRRYANESSSRFSPRKRPAWAPAWDFRSCATSSPPIAAASRSNPASASAPRFPFISPPCRPPICRSPSRR